MLNHRILWAATVALFAAAMPVLAKEKTEDALIQDLASRDAGKVTETLLILEKKFPTGTKALPTIKKLLTDSRVSVRRKAARVLGSLHTEVDQDNIKAICELLKSADAGEVTDGLKSLRGLKAPSAVPQVTPLLVHSNTHLVRDACRTLAAIGNKELIPTIEPLLSHKEPAVQSDAQNAISVLRGKPL
jgi:HEAT repeat protein